MGQIISNNNINNDEHEALYNDYIKLKSKYDSDRIKLETLNKLNNDLEENISKMTGEKSNNTDLETKMSELKVENNDLESKNNDLESKNNDLESKNSDLESKNSDLESKNSDLESKNSDLESKNSDLEKRYNDIKYNFNLNKKEKNILENKLNICEDLNVKYKKEIDCIIKSEGITLKKIKTINNVLNYYSNNQKDIVDFILKNNNTLLPDYFEKDIIINTYNTTIKLILDNIKNI